jgi:hypothetical protein
MSKIWAVDADIGDLNILPNGSITIDDSGMIYGRNTVSWQSTTVVTDVSITDATVSLSPSAYYFLYASSSGSTTPAGTRSGFAVTNRTNGSHDVTTKVLHYLGKAATDPPSS